MGKLVPRELEVSVVGMSYRLTPSTRKSLVRRVESETIPCEIRREPENMHDENALMVIVGKGEYKGMHIGYLPRQTALVLSPAIDSGEVQSVTGEITDIDAEQGVATMLLQFKAVVKVKRRAKKPKPKRNGSTKPKIQT